MADKYLKSTFRLVLYGFLTMSFVYGAVNPKDNVSQLVSIALLPFCYLGFKDCLDRRNNETTED